MRCAVQQIKRNDVAGNMSTAPYINPHASAPQTPARKRPLTIRWGKKLRRATDAVIARSSLVSNAPVLDPRDFAWTQLLRDNYDCILKEALAVLRDPEGVPLLDEISPDHRRIAPKGKWRSFFLRGYGCDIDENLACCPQTAEIVRRIPGLNSAFFSILAPGAHIPAHRGVTKGLLTCHLGLVVPKGPVRMRVDRQIVQWAEGQTLVFDDTYEHEVWNDTDETRAVLLVQFGRPLRAPGKWLADLFLWGVRHTAFVREARANIAMWGQTMHKVEAAHGLD
jgi:ornithine lipid ester-linked acyl 2-hydroxylase